MSASAYREAVKNWKLHHYILVGMGVGLVIGIGLNRFADPASSFFKHAVWWLDLLGKDLFVGCLMMIIAPLILASIVAGITTLPNPKELGSIGWRIGAYYFVTTCVAVGIGIALVLLIEPGKQAASQTVRAEREETLAEYRQQFSAKTGGANPLAPENHAAYMTHVAKQEGQVAASKLSVRWDRMQNTAERTLGDVFREDLIRPILSNPFAALSQVPPNSLGIIGFAIFLGLACVAVGSPAQPVMSFFQGMNEVMMRITLWVMTLAPVAIGCIVASMVAKMGMAALQSLAWYSAVVILGIIVHVCLLTFLVATLGKRSIKEFWRGIWEAWLVAFTTTSSAATLPVTVKCVTQNLKVSPKVANFSLPIGCTVNMDGTALYEGVAIIFMIQVFGGLDDVNVTLTAANTFLIFVTAVLASVGAAAVPSAGLVTMAIVAGAVGLPLYYIVFIYAVDHLLDMFRTSTNVLGDMVGAVIVDRWENEDARKPAVPISDTIEAK